MRLTIVVDQCTLDDARHVLAERIESGHYDKGCTLEGVLSTALCLGLDALHQQLPPREVRVEKIHPAPELQLQLPSMETLRV